jgi:citrate/tricarballylate utilization protein
VTAGLERQGPAPIAIEGRTSLHLLVQEAGRQLQICNACRYCEGLCAVFPALERRTVLSQGDISQLANLCHDCRACYDACMYDPPHEFAIDVPKALSAVRVADYQRYVWPPRVPRAFSGLMGVLLGGLLASVIVLVAAVANVGWDGLVRSHDTAASPYQLIPYWALLILMVVAGLYSVVVIAFAARSYWSEVGGTAGKFRFSAVAKAMGYAATLRYLRGGGADCYYPEDDKPTPVRRNLHALVAYGFSLCIVSTIAAGIEQDIAGADPPYPWLSVPVITGTVGGVGLVLGSLGLLLLKARSSHVTSFTQMTIKDYGLLVALTYLGLTGLATLLTRDTAAFGIVLLVHLAAVVESFAMAPYSKFMHLVFRFEALVRDNLEIAEQEKERAAA